MFSLNDVGSYWKATASCTVFRGPIVAVPHYHKLGQDVLNGLVPQDYLKSYWNEEREQARASDPAATSQFRVRLNPTDVEDEYTFR